METPLEVSWDRLVCHPAEPGGDTVVCCKTATGHPVALVLDDDLREALGLLLVDPDPDPDDAEPFDTEGD
ncbi:hypothetical protein [Streptomyces sp. I8-5]|uniref:hypothetical protein n=1 Tax=Streptomyces sp. I8-5 TaxID=3104277 RepID=UPI00386818E2